MNMSLKALTYKHLLEALVSLNLGEDNGQSTEGKDIAFDDALSRLLDKMDEVWYELTVEEIAQIQTEMSPQTWH